MLASIGHHADLEGVLVCLIVWAVIAFVVYLVCGPLLKQSWAATAAAIVFVVGALLCVL